MLLTLLNKNVAWITFISYLVILDLINDSATCYSRIDACVILGTRVSRSQHSRVAHYRAHIFATRFYDERAAYSRERAIQEGPSWNSKLLRAPSRCNEAVPEVPIVPALSSFDSRFPLTHLLLLFLLRRLLFRRFSPPRLSAPLRALLLVSLNFPDLIRRFAKTSGSSASNRENRARRNFDVVSDVYVS